MIANSSDDPDHASVAAFAKPLGSFSASNPRAVAYGDGEPDYIASREHLVKNRKDRAVSGNGAIAGRRANGKVEDRQPTHNVEEPERASSRYDKRSSSARVNLETGIDRLSLDEKYEPTARRHAPPDHPAPLPHHRTPPTTVRKTTPTSAAQAVSFRKPTAAELIISDDVSNASSSEEDDIYTYKTASESNLTNIVSNLHAGPSLGVGRGGTLITTSQALSLRCLVFPGEKGRSTFNEEWKGKGFEFNEREEVRYGLVQLRVRFFRNDGYTSNGCDTFRMSETLAMKTREAHADYLQQSRHLCLNN